MSFSAEPLVAHISLTAGGAAEEDTASSLIEGIGKLFNESTRLETKEMFLSLGDIPESAIVLSSPMFLYLAEPSQDNKQRPLTDIELATRLSYFL